MQAWRRKESASTSSDLDGEDSIRRSASFRLPDLQRDFRVELKLKGIVVAVLCLRDSGVKVTVMSVLTVMVVEREMAGSILLCPYDLFSHPDSQVRFFQCWKYMPLYFLASCVLHSFFF